MWNFQTPDAAMNKMYAKVREFLSGSKASGASKWRVTTAFLGASHVLSIDANGDWELHLSSGTRYRGQGSHITTNGELSESDINTFTTLYNKLVDHPQSYVA